MNPLSKEQMQKLSPEQQETLGEMETRRVQRRQELLEQARGTHIHIWGSLLICLPAMGLLFAIAGPERRLLGMFTLLFAVIFTQFRAACINRRLDALVELLDGGFGLQQGKT